MKSKKRKKTLKKSKGKKTKKTISSKNNIKKDKDIPLKEQNQLKEMSSNIENKSESNNESLAVNDKELIGLNGKTHTKDFDILKSEALLNMLEDLEKSKKESEKAKELYQSIFDSVLDGLILFDTKGNIIDVNKSASNMHGYTKEEFLKLKPKDFISKKSLKLFKKFLIVTLKGKEFNEKAQNIKKDGSNFDLEVKGIKFMYEDKPHILAILKDISKRKQLEEQYEYLFENSLSMLFVFNSEGDMIKTNKTALDFFGYDKKEILGKNYIKVIAKEDIKKIKDSLKKEFMGKETESIIVKIKRKKNDFAYVELAEGSIPIYKDNKISAVVVSGRDVSEKLKIQEKIQENEKKYRDVVDNVSDGILVFQDTKIVFANKGLCEILKYSHKDIIGKKFTKFIHPNDRKIALENYKKRTQGKKAPDNYILRGVDKDNSVKTLEVNVISNFIWEGKPATLNFLRDITTEKQAEEMLKESINGSPVPQFIIDKNHKIIYWNRALENISGYKAKDFLGTNNQWKVFYKKKRPTFADFVVDEKYSSLKKWYKGKYKKTDIKNAYSAIDFFPDIGKEGKWIKFTTAPIKNREGEIIAAIETLEDITERKRFEHEQLLLNNRLESAMEAGNIAWWEMELPSKKVFFNERKTKMLGYSSDKFKTYEDFTKLVHPDDYKKTMKAMRDHLKGKKSKYEIDYRIKTKSGKYKTFRDFGKIVEKKDDITFIAGIVIDITEQKENEEKLKESEENLRSFFENSVDPIAIIDINGKIKFVNHSLIKELGFTKKYMLNKNFMQFVDKSAKIFAKKHFKRLLKTGKSLLTIQNIRTKSGKTKKFSTRGTIIKKQKKPSHIVFVFRKEDKSIALK